MAHVLNPNRKGNPKVKRIRISLETRPSNNLWALCNKFKEKPEDYENKMKLAIVNIINIMDTAIETDVEDIREIELTKMDTRENLTIRFKRYIGCKLIEYIIFVSDFKNQYPMIDPKINPPTHIV